MRTSRNPIHLAPHVRVKFALFFDICRYLHDAGILKQWVFLTCTYRDHKAQANLYARGRTKPGPVVTSAQPGKSKHNRKTRGLPSSMAFDLAFTPAGKRRGCTYVGQWKLLGKVADIVGLKWGGNWRKPDKPHFYL